MGLPFFKKVVELQNRYGQPGSVVSNGLQTNATMIDAETAAFFHKYKFLVGCSLDGPAPIHDRYRLTAGGTTTHAKVLEGLDILKNNGVEFNILTLVSKANVAHPIEVYRYLVNQGYYYHQYIPCVEFSEDGQLLPFAITDEEWGEFLCKLFDEWYTNDLYRVSIRHFDSILSKLVDDVTSICTLGKNCCQYLVVEYNGDVYPCDIFVEEHFKIGNIMENDWDDLLQSARYTQFGAQKVQWHYSCQNCEVLDLCFGDCLKHRVNNDNPPQNLSVLCKGWKNFLKYSCGRFKELADRIVDQRNFGNRPSSETGKQEMRQ